MRHVSLVRQQSHHPSRHKMLGKGQKSQTPEAPSQQTFIKWFQALGKKKIIPMYY